MHILDKVIEEAQYEFTRGIQLVSTIPYKKSSTPIEQYGFNELIVLVIFTLVAIGVFLYLRKKDISQFNFVKNKKVKIIERTRISTRSNILLVQYKRRTFLLGQTPDNIALIAEVDNEMDD